MLGPYKTNKNGTISYKGNKLFNKIEDINSKKIVISDLENRANQFKDNPLWSNIAKINHRINIVAHSYFDNLGAIFTLLPLTTRMISSPGAVYGKEAINYTTDTCPITLKWFNQKKGAFLSESSQIYLELALMQQGVNQVYCVYNSFRKERADPTHLSEFHHIEYEGKVNQKTNEEIELGLIKSILEGLLKYNEKDLMKFLEANKLNKLSDLASNIKDIPRISYKEALDILFKETKEKRIISPYIISN